MIRLLHERGILMRSEKGGSTRLKARMVALTIAVGPELARSRPFGQHPGAISNESVRVHEPFRCSSAAEEWGDRKFGLIPTARLCGRLRWRVEDRPAMDDAMHFLAAALLGFFH